MLSHLFFSDCRLSQFSKALYTLDFFNVFSGSVSFLHIGSGRWKVSRLSRG